MTHQYHSEFQYRSYYKCELAMLYFPDSSSPHTAQNRLCRWINEDPQLVRALHAINYRKTRKFFFAREVRLICEHLGEP